MTYNLIYERRQLNMESWKKKLFEEMYDQVTIKGISICSTCKHYNGGSCSKGRSFGGFANKLDDCGEWEVCNNGL